jgi:hypothetical protein
VPAALIKRRTALPLWLPGLSMTTTSPALKEGTRNCSTPLFAGQAPAGKRAPLIGSSMTRGAVMRLWRSAHADGSCWSWPRACAREGGGLVDEHQAFGVKVSVILCVWEP